MPRHPALRSASQLAAKLFAVRSLNRFFVVGAVNTCIALVTFPALYLIGGKRFGLNLLLFVSAVFCTLFAFATHRLVTFQSQGPIRNEILKFFTLQGVIYLLNVVLFNALLHATPLHPVIIQLLLVVAMLVVNYAVLNAYVFPAKAQVDRAEPDRFQN